jgi:5'-nucleotidase
LSSDPSIFLLTNDDGWASPGLDALRRAAAELGPCRVVAPIACHSSCGHGVTTHAPIAVKTMARDVIAVGGTPADCVRLAIYELAPRPRWIFSGINAGGNLGADVHHSGTVAAVREGALHGIPGVALSHYIARGRTIDWALAARWAGHVLHQLVELAWEAGTFWNVNFPHPAVAGPDPEVVFCPLDPSPLPLAYRTEEGGFAYAGNYHTRARQPGCDVDVCFGNRIAVTLIRVAAAPGSARLSYPGGGFTSN